MSSNPYSISPQESTLFQQKYTELVGNTHELLTGDKARSFFLTSGLSTDMLWRIWSLVDPEKRGKISYQQFQIAMAVVKSVRRGNPLPSFIPQELLTSVPQPNLSTHPSLQPQTVPVPPQPTNPTYNRTSTPDGSHLPSIDPNSKRKFIQQFNTLDISRTGFVTGVQVKATMSKSFLPHLTLGRIWSLADCDKDGRLSSHEFVLAMHLIECAKLDLPLPDTLPQHLHPSLPLSLKKSPSPPTAPQQGTLSPLSSISSIAFPTRPMSPLQPIAAPSTNTSMTLPASSGSMLPPPSDGFQLDLSHFKQTDFSKSWNEAGLGLFMEDSVEMRKDRKLSLEDSKRENFLKGKQFLQKRMSEQFQIEDKRATELLYKKKSEEKLRLDRERVEHERRRSNSIKEIKLVKEREMVQLRRQQLEQERTKLNEEVDSLKSKVSSLQAEEEDLDMRKVDLESRLWHQDQFITSLKRDVHPEKETVPVTTQDKSAIQAQVKTQTNRLASLVSRKELLKRHLKSRETTQCDHLKEYTSLHESVSQLAAAVNRLREEKGVLETRAPLLTEKLTSLRKHLADTHQQTREAKQRAYELECKVRKKGEEIELRSTETRMRSRAFIESPLPIPVNKHSAPVTAAAAPPQDVKFDPFEASLRSINAARDNRDSNIPDLMNVFTSTQPLARDSNIFSKPEKKKEVIDSHYEIAGAALIDPSLKANKQPPQPQPQQEESIYHTSYNTIISDDITTTPQQVASIQANPEPVQHETYVDSNTLMEYYANVTKQKQESDLTKQKKDSTATKQKQETNILRKKGDSRPLSYPAASNEASSVQDNIHYQVSPNKTEKAPKPNKPPPPFLTRSSQEPGASTSSSTGTHRLSALYDFESGEAGVLSFKKGDLFSWRPEFDGPDDGWMGAEINGKTGIVPETYIQKMQSRVAPPIPVPYTEPKAGKPETQPIQSSNQPVEEIYAQPQKYLTKSQLENQTENLSVEPYQVEARVAYKGRIAEQISFEKGTVITVTKEKAQSKWLFGSIGSSSGWFPKFSVTQIPKPQPKAMSALKSGGTGRLFEDSFERTCDLSNQANPAAIESALNQILGKAEKSDKDKKERTNLSEEKPQLESSDMYLALFDFSGTQDGDLVFQKNDHIQVSRKYDEWLYGECNGKSGYLPANYVAKITQPRGSTDESPIYDNIEIPIAPKRNRSSPASNIPPSSPTSDPVGAKKPQSVFDIKSKFEQTNTVYTASIQEPSSNITSEPIVSKSQPTNPFPQATPRSTQPTSQSIQLNPSSSSVDASQEECSISPFTTTASMRFKQRGGDFSFQSGDTIHITKTRSNGKWYFGRVENSGNSGWFPCSFVPAKQPESSNTAPNKSSPVKQMPGRITPPEIGSYYMALYDYHQAYDQDLSFIKGDQIKLVAVDGEWGTGELDGKRGYFPMKYVKRSIASGSKKGNGSKFTVVFPYTAQNDDEISLSNGDVVTFISKSTENWWRGELNGKVGLFPANNVQEVRAAFVQNDAKSLEKEIDFVITEIVASELAYLSDLHLVEELIFQPIEKNRLLTQTQLKQIMVNWRELVAVSMLMAEGMQTDPHNPKKSIVTIAHLFHSQMSSLQKFVTWCSNQSNAINLLHKKLEGDASIRELQTMWSQDPRTTYLSISSFMLKPMQRVTKYQLFLKRLLELCPSGDSALHAKLETSLAHLEKICLEANEGVRLQENKTKVEWVLNHVEFAENEALCKNILCSPVELADRKLLYTGKLVKTNSNKELIGFLFSDLLLLTRPSKNLFQRHISTSDLFEDDECKLINYRCPYTLKNITSIKPCVGDECCFLLEVFDTLENQIRSLQLRAEDMTTSKNWLKLLEEGMIRCREDKLFEVSTDVGGSLAEGLRSEYKCSSVTGDVDLV